MTMVAVTGARGFVGRAVVDALCSAHGVLVREMSRTSDRGRPSDELVVGDIGDVAACDRLVDGADVVVHAAGLVRSTDAVELRRINVEGTRTIVRAARRAGVARFIFLSSTGVYGMPGTIADETSPHRPRNAYERSKSVAEATVGEEWGPVGCVVLRPSNIIGAGHPLRPLRRLFAATKAGRPLIRAGAWSNYVGVRDVAKVVLAAATVDDVPPSLIINVPMPLDRFVMQIGEVVGVPGQFVGLPGSIARFIAPMVRSVSKHVTRLARLAALFDQTRFCTIHHAWFEQHRVMPAIDAVLLEMARDYDLVADP